MWRALKRPLHNLHGQSSWNSVLKCAIYFLDQCQRRSTIISHSWCQLSYSLSNMYWQNRRQCLADVMWFVALAMTLVSDLNKGSLCASKVSVPLVSGAQQGRERGGEREREREEKKKREPDLYFTCVCPFHGVLCQTIRVSLFIVVSRRDVLTCASMHKRPTWV